MGSFFSKLQNTICLIAGVDKVAYDKEIKRSQILIEQMNNDFDNYKKRSDREKNKDRNHSSLNLIERLLPVLDALESSVKSGNDAEFNKDGAKRIEKLLLNILKKEGIEVLETKGKVFNPAQHEAVDKKNVEGLKCETVLEEFRKGYRIGEHILRAPLVVVGIPVKKTEEK